jgi:hypothetical protein
MKNLPKEILVWKCDETEDGSPVYSVACSVHEIPEDADGEKVGIYVLNRQSTFALKRELK